MSNTVLNTASDTETLQQGTESERDSSSTITSTDSLSQTTINLSEVQIAGAEQMSPLLVSASDTQSSDHEQTRALTR